ncbi:hypothetical protein GCM10017750_00670 [Streptomyces racemochromogenes]
MAAAYDAAERSEHFADRTNPVGGCCRIGGVSSFRRTLSRTAVGAAAGLLAAFSALAVAELVAGAVRPAAGPITAVGGAVTDRTPAAVKDLAIRTFEEDDKAVLRLGILAVASPTRSAAPAPAPPVGSACPSPNSSGKPECGLRPREGRQISWWPARWTG